MKTIKTFSILLTLLVVSACSNDNNNVLQRLNDEPAIVREVKGANNLFVFDLLNYNNSLYSSYIVPSNALPVEYKEDGLSVIISGDVTTNSLAIDGYISEGKGNSVILGGKYNMFELITMSKNEGEIYYVVGYDGNREIDNHKETAKSGGYLFISENLKDSLYANNLIFEGDVYRYGDLLDGIIDFPMESMTYNGTYCGERFFPEEYRFAFKVQINSYRPMTEEELQLYTVRLIPAICYNPIWEQYRFKTTIITSIYKIQ